LSLPVAVSQAGCRQTNVDLIASWLREHAKPNDLVLVYPWYCGVTFNHYYNGATPWTTVPSLADHRLHRYDLLMEKMTAVAPIQDVLDRVAQTLGGGNTLWIVGQLPAPVPGEAPAPDLPPAPNGPQGWSDDPYTYAWGRQVENYVSTHAQRVEPVQVAPDGCVSGFEDLTLFQAAGKSLPAGAP
jgi:hypothetical protein